MIADEIDEEQEAFQDAVRYVGLAWMQASRLRLRNLTDTQYIATSELLTALASFTLALRSEFSRQPQTKSVDAELPPLRAAVEAPLPTARRTENPYDKVVTAVGYAWSGLSDLLSMPNRLNEAQRACAGDALEAIAAFMQTDFRGSSRLTDCEAA